MVTLPPILGMFPPQWKARHMQEDTRGQAAHTRSGKQAFLTTMNDFFQVPQILTGDFHAQRSGPVVLNLPFCLL